jgi:hypothetical protein
MMNVHRSAYPSSSRTPYAFAVAFEGSLRIG